MPVILLVIIPHFCKMVALLKNLGTNTVNITNVLIEKTSQGTYGTLNLRKGLLLNESMFTQACSPKITLAATHLAKWPEMALYKVL